MREITTPSPLATQPAFLKAWALLCLGVYVAYAACSILTSRGFYADGSFFFVHIVAAPEALNYFDDSKHIRLFVNVINQFPLILMTKWGLAEPTALRVAFNVPLFLWSALLLALLWRYAKRHQSYLVWCYAAASYITTVLPSDIFAVNQARLAQTIYWGIIFFATAPKALRTGEKLVLGMMVIAAFRSHEAIIVFGPLITLAACLGWWRVKTDRLLRTMLALSGIALTLFGLHWQQVHPVSDATAGFLRSYDGWSSELLFRSNLFFSWSLIAILAASLAFGGWRPFHHLKPKEAALYLYPVICLFIGFLPFMSPSALAPSQEFSFRLLIPFGGAALASLALLDHFLGAGRHQWNCTTVILVMSSSLLGHSMWQLANTAAWATLCDTTREVLAHAPGPVIPSQAIAASASTRGNALAMKYQWGWTWPAFSIALSSDRTIRAMIAPDHHLDHFYVSASTPSVLHIPFGRVGARYWDVAPVVAICQADSRSLLECHD